MKLDKVLTSILAGTCVVIPNSKNTFANYSLTVCTHIVVCYGVGYVSNLQEVENLVIKQAFDKKVSTFRSRYVRWTSPKTLWN